MAHVVGVPKRDPCRKCQLPVFLAERLMVGKKVYHRTCLKCARCGYQLTPGSFYETEVDDQYCCETCPDEEVTTDMQMSNESDLTIQPDVKLRNKPEGETNLLPSPTRSVRSSIKERLAFFERQRDDEETNTKLLQKSLSDEEKSKSLQRMENSNSSYKPNKALASFLNNTVNDEEDDLSEQSSSIQNSKMETSDSENEETDDLTNMCMPPELPKSLPPLDEDHNIEEKSEETKIRFTSSAQLVLLETTNEAATVIEDEQQNIIQETNKENQTSELQKSHTFSKETDKTNNNSIINEDQFSDESLLKVESKTEETIEATIQLNKNQIDNNLEFSETNDNSCVTKDKPSDKLTIEDVGKPSVHPEDDTNTDTKTMPPTLNESLSNIKSAEDEDKTDEIRTKSAETTDKNDTLTLEDVETSQRLSVVSARLQQFEVISNNEKSEKVIPSILHENDVDNEILNENIIKNPNSNDNITPETTMSSIRADNVKIESESANPAVNDSKVPLTTKTKDNEDLESKLEDSRKHLDNRSNDNINNIQAQQKNVTKTTIEEYPDDLNPFKSDEENEDEALNDSNKENSNLKTSATSTKKDNLNPFDSSDDEVELEKSQNSRISTTSASKIPPPRPPPPRISKNPFGSEDEDDIATQNFERRSSLTASQSRKTPVPTPRSNISQSQNPTPEPTPRLSSKINATIISQTAASPNNILQNSSEYYGSANSLHSVVNTTPLNNLLRNSEIRSSSNSLNLSAGGTIRSRKSRRAPLPPAPVKELFPSSETINSSSKTSTPSSSTVGTPRSARKKRPAPAPPKPARLESAQLTQTQFETISTQPKNLNSYPLQNELDSKLSDEEKALLEGKTSQSLFNSNELDSKLSPSSRRNSKRLIPLDKELLEEHGSLQYIAEGISQCDDLKEQNQQKTLTSEENEVSVVYRRVIIPQNLETPTHEHNPLVDNLSKSSLGERQLEKIKDNKESNNRNRQSQISVASSGADDSDPLLNKSAHGKWKRRKGPAPALPIPPRKVLQMLPLQEIKHELEIIEVQQQGLEKQGVILEKMIRDRCEGENGEPLKMTGPSAVNDEFTPGTSAENSKEVENLILQLFELVNEKNELFRRQAELMYLRRQHRLEQEQADLEYEIRILMAQPERNKTDSDKAREEALIERLVEVVKLRNEVVECLEMDRIREAEEDQSIKQRLESHMAKRDDDSSNKKTLIKLSKKEKKKQKEAKKLSKSNKVDADKDADESEINLDKQKSKKKKKLLIF